MKTVPKHRFEIRIMTEDEGTGYLVTFPDLPGCMSDGETIEEAIENAADAEKCWLEADDQWTKEDEKKAERFTTRIPQMV